MTDINQQQSRTGSPRGTYSSLTNGALVRTFLAQLFRGGGVTGTFGTRFGHFGHVPFPIFLARSPKKIPKNPKQVQKIQKDTWKQVPFPIFLARCPKCQSARDIPPCDWTLQRFVRPITNLLPQPYRTKFGRPKLWTDKIWTDKNMDGQKGGHICHFCPHFVRPNLGR